MSSLKNRINHSFNRLPLAAMFTWMCLAVVAAPSAPAGEVTATWTGNGTTNRWGESANWSPVGVPNNNGADTYHVVIDGDPGSDVEVVLDFAPVNIDTLTIHAGDTLTLAPPATLNVHGGLVVLNGLMQINPTNATGLTRLIFPEDAHITGPGELRMMGQPGRCLVQIGGDDILTIGETPEPPGGNPTVHGRGVISGGGLTNYSTITADWPDAALILYFIENLTNNGIINGSLPAGPLAGQTSTISIDFGNVQPGSTGMFRGRMGFFATQFQGGSICQAHVDVFATTPGFESSFDNVSFHNSDVTFADGSTTFLNNTTGNGSNVMLGANATLNISSSSWTNGDFIGEDGSVTNADFVAFQDFQFSSAGLSNWALYFDGSDSINDSQVSGVDFIALEGSTWNVSNTSIDISTISGGTNSTGNIDGVVILNTPVLGWEMYFDGSDSSLTNSTVTDTTISIQDDVTVYGDNATIQNTTVTGTGGGTFEITNDGKLDSSTIENVNFVLNGLPLLRLHDAVIIRALIMSVFGQTTLEPEVTTANVTMEGMSIEEGNPGASLNVDSGVDFVSFAGVDVNVTSNLGDDVRITGTGTSSINADMQADNLTVEEQAAVDLAFAIIDIVEANSQGRTTLTDAEVAMTYFAMFILSEIFVDGNAPLAGGGLSVMTVSDQLTFEMIDESHWSWGPTSTLAMTGGVGATTSDFGPWGRMEIGGTDLGTDAANHVGDPAGFDNNFDLSILRIGPDAHVYLEDAIDNGNRGGIGGAAEALYVDTLEFADGAGQLNLNGLHLYYGTLNGDANQIIDQPVAAPCPADTNGSGSVDVTDLLALLAAWGPCAPPCPPTCAADINGDCVVNVTDLLALLAAWGPCS